MLNKNSPFSNYYLLHTFQFFTLSHKLIILFIGYGLCLTAQTKIYFGSSGNLKSLNTNLTEYKQEYYKSIVPIGFDDANSEFLYYDPFQYAIISMNRQTGDKILICKQKMDHEYLLPRIQGEEIFFSKADSVFALNYKKCLIRLVKVFTGLTITAFDEWNGNWYIYDKAQRKSFVIIGFNTIFLNDEMLETSVFAWDPIRNGYYYKLNRKNIIVFKSMQNPIISDSIDLSNYGTNLLYTNLGLCISSSSKLSVFDSTNNQINLLVQKFAGPAISYSSAEGGLFLTTGGSGYNSFRLSDQLKLQLFQHSTSEYPWFTVDQVTGKIFYYDRNTITDKVGLNSMDFKESSIQKIADFGTLAEDAYLDYDFFNGKIYFSDFNNKQISSYDLSTQIIQSIYSWPDMKQDSRFQLDPWNQLIFIARSGGLDKFSLQNQTTEFISLLEPIKYFRIHPLLRKLTVKNSSMSEFTYDGTLLRKFNILGIDGNENDLHYDLSSNILYSYSFRDSGAGLETWYIQKLDDQLFSRTAIYYSHQPFFKNIVFLYEKIPTAVNNPKLESEEMVIYPNPNSGKFEIRWVGVSEYPSSIDLYSVYGTNVPISIQPSGFNTLLCKLNNYQPGIYTLVIRFGNNKRIIKKINIL